MRDRGAGDHGDMSTSAEMAAKRAALDSAIAAGITSVSIAGRTVNYRSIDEMMSARAFLTQQIAAATGAGSGSVKRFVFTTMRGD